MADDESSLTRSDRLSGCRARHGGLWLSTGTVPNQVRNLESGSEACRASLTIAASGSRTLQDVHGHWSNPGLG